MKPLEADLRRMMAPNTASRLKVRERSRETVNGARRSHHFQRPPPAPLINHFTGSICSS